MSTLYDKLYYGSLVVLTYFIVVMILHDVWSHPLVLVVPPLSVLLVYIVGSITTHAMEYHDVL